MSQPTLNRAMRRKLKKKGIKPPQPLPTSQNILPTSLAELLQAHPEYIKFELDEQKIQELEEKEKLKEELEQESGDDSHA